MTNYSKYVLALGLTLFTGCSHQKYNVQQNQSQEAIQPVQTTKKLDSKNSGVKNIKIYGYIIPKNLMNSMQIAVAKENKNYHERITPRGDVVSRNWSSCGARACPEIWKTVLRNADLNGDKKIVKSELEKLLSK